MNVKRIGINIISGGAGYVVPMAINVLSTPFVINHLGKEAYGLQVLANVIIGYLIAADMGMDIPIIQKVAEHHVRNERELQSNFLVATLKIYGVIGVTGMLILFIFTNPLVTWLSIPVDLQADARYVFYLSAIGFLGSIINMWGKAVFNGIHRYDLSNGVGIFNNLFGIGLGIFLILRGYGVVGFFAARVAGFLISNVGYMILISRFLIRVRIVPIIDWEIWRFLSKKIGYGFMLRISGMIFSRMDQILIGAWIGISQVTVYSIPILIASTLSGLIASIIQFAFPLVSAMSISSSLQQLEPVFLKITKSIVIVTTMIFIPFIVFGDKFLSLWINPEIASQSHTVLFMLMIAFYINAVLNNGMNLFIVAVGHLRYFTFYSIGRSVFLFGGFIFLIKPFGIEGAGMAYLLALIVDFIFIFYTLEKILNYDVSSLFFQAYLKPVFLGLFLACGLFLLRDQVKSWIGLIIATTIFELVFFALALVTGIIDDSSKEMMSSLLRKKKN